ncbi:unnamed protein product [Heligmosomoides polygyrus]|uniref:NR LBD domain-containing protein n=1 Tax=Heligmosomoides polygyrus TaxID=6339 RepID=A0A183F654_HELPZ|nr:unnamed protein product [Heligmosomoides polygyrus]
MPPVLQRKVPGVPGYLPKEFTNTDKEKRDKLLMKKTDISIASSLLSCADSALELDVFDDGSYLSRLQAFALSQMETLFAQLQLRVQDTSFLPRPPVYCAQNTRAEQSLELRIFAKLHLYLQLLLISLQKTNRISIEINRVHSALSEDANTKQSHSVLTQVLVLVLRTIYRDQFSLAVAENRSDVPTVAAKYNALIRDDIDDAKQLQPWMELASENDREHINRFLVFITERFPERVSTLISISKHVILRGIPVFNRVCCRNDA